MKKSSAIQFLKQQRNALTTVTNIKEWRDTTNAFLEEAMNTEKQAFKDFKYYQENDIAGLTSRLDLCISIVEKIGVHGASKVNWLCRLSDTYITAILISGGSLLFWLGTLYPSLVAPPAEPSKQETISRPEPDNKGNQDSVHVSNGLSP